MIGEALIKEREIRENITPRGDGNKLVVKSLRVTMINIRENITPRGDGNLVSASNTTDI